MDNSPFCQVSETKEEAQQPSIRVRVRTTDGPETQRLVFPGTGRKVGASSWFILSKLPSDPRIQEHPRVCLVVPSPSQFFIPRIMIPIDHTRCKCQLAEVLLAGSQCSPATWSALRQICCVLISIMAAERFTERLGDNKFFKIDLPQRKALVEFKTSILSDHPPVIYPKRQTPRWK